MMRPLLLRALLFLLVFAIGVGIAYNLVKPSDELPIYTPGELDPRLVDSSLRRSFDEHRILDFSLTDQSGRKVTGADVEGKVVLAEFFFTTCGSICPRMSAQLERVQAAYRNEARFVILSHTVTPEIDSVPVLSAYAELHGADPERWRFLTGDRRQIYNLARKSWFAVKDSGDGGPDDFVHTENLVLADTLGRLRGFYDGTDPKDVDRAIGDIRKLLGR